MPDMLCGALKNEGARHMWWRFWRADGRIIKDINGRTRKKLMTYGMGIFSLSGSEHADGFWKHSSEGAVPQGGALQGERMLELGPDWKTADGIAKQIAQKNKKTEATRKRCGCCFGMMKRLK